MSIYINFTEFSVVPSRPTGDPELFSQQAFTSLAEQARLVGELNTWKGQANQTAETINQAKLVATAKASEALTSQQAASTSEFNALNYRNDAQGAMASASTSAEEAAYHSNIAVLAASQAQTYADLLGAHTKPTLTILSLNPLL